MKVTRNEWLFRFRQGKSTVDGTVVDDEDDDDSVDAVEIDRVVGLPPVETVGAVCVLGSPPVETVHNDDACGGRRV